jgi:hypothetical protein
MSEIATLEKLEPYLAQVVISVAAPAAPAVEAPPVMANGRQGSHLELFFSEVQYSTFVTKKKTAIAPPEKSSNSGNGALKFSLKLHSKRS